MVGQGVGVPVVVASPLEMSAEQRRELEVMSRSSSLPHRTVVQARALLWAADGVANSEIARRCSTTADAVRRWRARFATRGRLVWGDRPGPGPQADRAGRVSR
jgi:hypothetical protein